MKKCLVIVLLLGLLAACSDSDTATSEFAPTIVGGEDAQENEFPFMAALWGSTNPNSFFCGASVLSEDWIITAAHCVDGGSFIVVAGDHQISSVNGLERGRRPEEVIIHPDYFNSRSRDGDIALVKLANPFELNDVIQPIPYASSLVPADTSVEVIGWGLTSGRGRPADILQKVDVTVRSPRACGSSDPSAFCAIDTNPVTDACNGDSGGPVFTDEGELIGLVSNGPIACDSRGFYSDVTFYSDWIEEETGIEQSF